MNRSNFLKNNAVRVVVILLLTIALLLDIPFVAGQGSSAYAETLEKFIDVSLSEYHMLVVTDDHRLYAFGKNGTGIIGNGSTENTDDTVKVLDNVVSCSAGSNSTAAITEDGSLWYCGTNILWNNEDLIANAGEYAESDDWGRTFITRPVKIRTGVKSVDVREFMLAFIDNNDSLWLWGSDCEDLLDAHDPVKVMDNVKQVSLGGWGGSNISIGAVKTDGSLWTWGVNSNGNLGFNDENNRSKPVKLMDNVQSVSMGDGLCGAVKTDGTLWTWGNEDKSGALPSKFMDNVRSISIDRYTAGAVKTDGSLWTWGYNVYGGVGDGTMEDRNEPIKVLDGINKVSMGVTSAAIDNDGGFWFWGNVKFQSFWGDGEEDRWLKPTSINLIVGEDGSGGTSGDSGSDYKEYRFPEDTYSFRHGELEYLAKGYYITLSDYEKLIREMPEAALYSSVYNPEWRPPTPFNVDEMSSNYEEWGGSCYGVSLGTMLLNKGILDLKDISDKNIATTSAAAPSRKLFSVVDFYQFQQSLPGYIQLQDEFNRMSVPEKLARIESEIDEHGSSMVVFNFVKYRKNEIGMWKSDQYGHAVVAYGTETNEKGWEVDYTNFEGKSITNNYKKRFVIYDCNTPKKTVYLYYNDNGGWFFPGGDENAPIYNAYGDGKGSPMFRKNSFNFTPFEVISGMLIGGTGDVDEMNIVDYHTGKYKYPDLYIECLSVPDYAPFHLAWGDGMSADIEDFTVDYKTTVESDKDKVIPLGVPARGVNAPGGRFRYSLPTNSDTYKIKSSEKDLDIQLTSSDTSTNVSAGSTGEVTLDSYGTVDAKFDSKCDYNIRYLANLLYNEQEISVKGKDSTAIKMKPCEDGIRISGDNLNGTTISSNDPSESTSKTITINTDSKDLEVKTAYGEMEVFEDKDGDGVYSDKVDLSTNGQTDNGSGETSKPVAIKSVKLSKTSYVYNGKTRRPTVKVTDVNGKVLKKNTDYKLTYNTKGKNVGRHKIKVTFINDYKGNASVTKTYKINPKTTSIKSLKAGTKKFTVKWKKQSSKMSTKKITGYQVRYATNKAFTKNVKTKKVKSYKKTSLTVKSLKAKKTYYVKVRTYRTISGKTYYGKWSKVKKVKTKK